MNKLGVPTSIWSHIENRVSLTPEKRFLVDEFGRSYSFKEFYQEVCKYAGWLRTLGVVDGARVAWQLPTRVESIFLCAALCKINAVQVPMLPILRHREVSFMCRQAGVDLLIVMNEWGGFDYAGLAQDVATEGACRRWELLPTLEEIDCAQADTKNPICTEEADRERWIFYTSGTTSDPKGARHADRGILSTAMGMNACLELTAADVVPMVFPFTHIGGIIWLASMVMTGCECFVLERFSERVFPAMSAAGVTVAGAGTVFIQEYIRYQKRLDEQPLFSRLRCTTGGGATKPPNLHRDVREILGGRGYVSGYGMTECPIATMNTLHDPDRQLATTEGRPMPGMLVKIVDRDGRQLGPNDEGEICLKGPHLCLGYVDSALDTDAFDADGYLRTGDIGRVNADGWLSVTGRIKDVIIRKGENISAKRVEDVISGHPAIDAVSVIGLADEERGELACACVVPANNMGPVGLAELEDFCIANGLRRQECPERVEVLPSLPTNASGKVLKEELKRQLAAGG